MVVAPSDATVIDIDASAIRVVTTGPRLPPNTRIRVRTIAQKDYDEEEDEDVATPGLDDTVTLAVYGWRARAFINDDIVHDAVLHSSPRIEEHVMDGVDATLCAGLEAATLSASVGERLGVVVPSGGAPFADAPFDAPRDVYIEYEIELLSIKRATQRLAVDTRDEDVARYAEAKKSEANALFSRGEYARALRRYDDGARALERVLMSGAASQTDVKATERALLTFHVNSAASLLKLERFVEVCERCDDALDIEATNVKAMYRKSQALEALGELTSALEVLREALELSKDRAIRESFVRIRRQITAADAAERAVYERMMDGNAMAAMEAKEQKLTASTNDASRRESFFGRCSRFCRERPYDAVAGASMCVAAAVVVARGSRAGDSAAK